MRYFKKKSNVHIKKIIPICLVTFAIIITGSASVLGVKYMYQQKLNIANVSVSTASGTTLQSSSAISSTSEEQSRSSLSSSSTSTESSISSSSSQVNKIVPPSNDKYPELYTQKIEKEPAEKGDKVIYLTFDDGPSAITPKVLDVLDQFDIKATFFVVGKTDDFSKKTMKDIVKRGHAIGVHTYTHQLRKIYASKNNYLEDFSKMHQLIYDTTGVKTDLFRFAGGSINGYNKKDAKEIIQEMTRRGYTYYDWNVCAGDAEKGATQASIYRNTIRQSKAYNKCIALFHDASSKHDTLVQLPKIIEQLKKFGYRFDKLDSSVEPIIFKIPN